MIGGGRSVHKRRVSSLCHTVVICTLLALKIGIASFVRFSNVLERMSMVSFLLISKQGLTCIMIVIATDQRIQHATSYKPPFFLYLNIRLTRAINDGEPGFLSSPLLNQI